MNTERTFRGEIQGLRAVAVLLVLLFHIWPDLLPGGYVGVDVFFVISGYLITGLLVRAAMRDGRISLLDFYSRRARRLLPVATLVLAISLVGTFFFLPQARWVETVIQIAASALYVQNWVLAFLSVDYLGAENAASPVQHYWSLAIEEQFYLLWPFIMIVTLLLAKRFRISLRAIFIAALAAIFVSSLVASTTITARDQGWAYFVTHTRMWELALGGLLALTIHRISIRGAVTRAALMMVGLTAIIWSALTYSAATPFPGWAALVPTLGTVAIIVAGQVQLGLFSGLDTKLLRYIGDRSYSIYLWHWPLIVFYTVGRDGIGLVDGVAILVITLALSHISYRYVEERYRHPKAARELRPLGYSLASFAFFIIAAGLTNIATDTQSANLTFNENSHPGPLALLDELPVPEGVAFAPPIANLRRDLPVVYRNGCHQDQVSAEPIHCLLGDTEATRSMAIVGDSHAAQWVPALETIAETGGWNLITMTKSACAFARVEVRRGGEIYPSCMEWRENAIAALKEMRPEIVFVSQSRGYSYVGHETMLEGLRSVWSELIESGMKVAAIHDTPWMSFEPSDCVGASTSTNCSDLRSDVEAPYLFPEALAGMEGASFIDLTDGVCNAETCDAVVGNIIVWRDRHHLSATYAEALAPYLAEKAGLEFQETISADVALSCDALGTDPEMSRTITFAINDNNVSHRFGDWRAKNERFDDWSGVIDGNTISMSGTYIQGAGGVKSVEFSGVVDQGRLQMTGTRGSRICTITGQLPA